MEALLLLIMGAYGVVCFMIGASVRQKVDKGEPIEIKANPMEKIRERMDKKAADREQERNDIILQNIEAYDGTGKGQKDVPR